MIWLLSGSESGRIRVGDLQAGLILVSEGTIVDILRAILKLNGISNGRTWSVAAIEKSLKWVISLGLASIAFQFYSIAHMFNLDGTMIDVMLRILCERMYAFVRSSALRADSVIKVRISYHQPVRRNITHPGLMDVAEQPFKISTGNCAVVPHLARRCRCVDIKHTRALACSFES